EASAYHPPLTRERGCWWRFTPVSWLGELGRVISSDGLQPSFPRHEPQWPVADFLAYSCAAARDSHPLPIPHRMMRMREPNILKERKETWGESTRARA